MEVPTATCSFPTIDQYCNAVVIRTKGKGILYQGATSKVISLGRLLRAGYKVDFVDGRPGNHQYGGTITAPDGTVITMIFHKEIWRLPTLTKEAAAAKHHCAFCNNLTAENSSVPATNPFWELLDLARKVEPKRASEQDEDVKAVEEVDQRMMQLIHDKWGHPSNSKMEMIYR
eukprot:2717646-Rhodomonas_salina.1